MYLEAKNLSQVDARTCRGVAQQATTTFEQQNGT